MFQGFSNETVDFMWGIRFNNEKSWFEQHKETYRAHFYEPMKALAAQVYEIFQDRHGDLELATRVSRIYRDARRLRGRGPYKDRLWFSMERPSEAWTHDPVFWFELAPEGYSYGMGYYAAKPATMARFRARLDRDPKPFEKLARPLERQDVFTLEHACYKKPKGDLGKLLVQQQEPLPHLPAAPRRAAFLAGPGPNPGGGLRLSGPLLRLFPFAGG